MEKTECAPPDPYLSCLTSKATEVKRKKLSIGCNAKFCNFRMVAMATGVVREYIQMTPLDCPTPKIRALVQTARNYFFYGDRVIPL